MEDVLEYAGKGITFDEIKKKDYFSSEEVLDNVDVLILPYERIRDGYDILFPERTKSLLHFLKQSNSLSVDVPCSDEEYVEIEMHDSWIDLGIFLATSVALPILVNLISDFLHDLITKEGKNPNKVDTKLEINVDNKGKSIKYKYKGPAATFKKSLEEVEKIVNDDDE